VDESTYYLDIPHGAGIRASGGEVASLPLERGSRAKDRLSRAHLAVLVEHGRLGHFQEDRFEFRDLPFCAAQRYTYATVYRRCAPAPVP